MLGFWEPHLVGPGDFGSASDRQPFSALSLDLQLRKHPAWLSLWQESHYLTLLEAFGSKAKSTTRTKLHWHSSTFCRIDQSSTASLCIDATRAHTGVERSIKIICHILSEATKPVPWLFSSRSALLSATAKSPGCLSCSASFCPALEHRMLLAALVGREWCSYCFCCQ